MASNLRDVFEIDDSKLRCQLAISDDMDDAGLKHIGLKLQACHSVNFLNPASNGTAGARNGKATKAFA